MQRIEMSLIPQCTGILAGHASELNVLLKIQAPDAPEQEREGSTGRPPLNLSLVIDRSGSMDGRPLEEAKRSAAMVIDSLLPTDFASMVIYDSGVDVLVPARPVGDRLDFHRAIASIHSGGTTALFDGWRQGAEQAGVYADGAATSRVLLLSDGMANQGLRHSTEIAPYCAQYAERGITTSTFGLSHQFNEQLMLDMAREGLGNSYYGECAEDLIDPFREETALLGSMCAKKLRLRLEAPQAVGIRLMNSYTRNADSEWVLPNLAWGGEAWAIIKLSLPETLEPQPGENELRLLSSHIGLTDMDDRPIDVEPAHLRLPFLPASAFAMLVQSEIVLKRVQELRAAEIQIAAREAAIRGDWQEVEMLIETARAEAGDNAWLRDSLDSLMRLARRREQRAFSKEAMYQSSKFNTRLADKYEEEEQYNRYVESRKEAYLRRKMEQGKRQGPGDERPDT